MNLRPLLIGLLLLATAVPALAERPPRDGLLGQLLQQAERPRGESHDRGNGRDRGEARVRYSLSQAVSAVQRSTKGRVLSAENRGGGYRIKVLLPGGRVRIYQVDPASGAGLP